MTNIELVNKAIDIAKNYKTLYVMGCFGAPMNSTNKKRYTTNHSYNKQSARTKIINNATSDTFGFDCVNLIKGILWGWSGNKSLTYGGAKYATNGVPDTNADGMIGKCKEVSTNFNKIEKGEVVWLKGHIGIYIGDGLAVECTPKWENKVQITAVGNIGKKAGYNTRTWTKHGKLPYITYSSESTPEPAKPILKTIDEIAKEVIKGKWGNGTDRKNKLIKAGYDYSKVQERVNELLKGETKTKKYIQINTLLGVWCRKEIGFSHSKFKVIPYKTKCELITKNAGKANGYTWDKIIYKNTTVYLPNKWNKYL